MTGKWRLTGASPPPVYFQAANRKIVRAVKVIRVASWDRTRTAIQRTVP